MRTKSAFTLALAAAMALVPAACSKDKNRKFVSIGTGGETGVYYPTGGAIASIVNESKDEHGLDVSFKSSEGSVQNINAVLKGDMEFGIAQADRVYQAAGGKAEWSDQGPQDKLRVVCVLHSETINCLSAEDANVMKIADLKGKTVNIGAPGSGQRQNAIDVLTASGLNVDEDIEVEGLNPKESPGKIQDGQLDAYFYTVGHPNGSLKEACAGLRRKIRFVPITGMDDLIAKAPYYSKAVIPIGEYDGAVNTEDVPTIGMKALLVSSADVDAETVYIVVKQLLANLDKLNGAHPALAGITAESMVAYDDLAPLHVGAAKAFAEAGVLPAE